MLIKDLEELMEKIAPSYLKEDYDNVGLMVGNSEDKIKGILISLDCTLEAIDEAIDKKCNLIFTHHPLLFKRPYSISDETLLGKKIIKLIKNDINVYSAHTNLDKIYGGINDTLVNILGLNYIKSDVIDMDEKGGIGRLITLKECMTLENLLFSIKKAININSLRYCGKLNKSIKKLAVINGSGEDYENKAIALGADCILTGDTSYHYVSDSREMEIPIIDGEHFFTEWPAFIEYSNKLFYNLKEKESDFAFYISKTCKSPYNFI